MRTRISVFLFCLSVIGLFLHSSQSLALPRTRSIDLGAAATPTCIRVLPDGGFILGGALSSDLNGQKAGFLLRLNAQGDSLWSKRYRLPEGVGSFQSVAAIPSGGFLAVGASEIATGSEVRNTRYQPNRKAWFVRVSERGDVVWTRRYGYEFLTEANDIVIASDGSIYTTGGAQEGVVYDANGILPFVMKLSLSGDSLWMKTYNQFFGIFGSRIQQLSNREFLVAATTNHWSMLTDSRGLFAFTISGNGNVVRQSDSLHPTDAYFIDRHFDDWQAGGLVDKDFSVILFSIRSYGTSNHRWDQSGHIGSNIIKTNRTLNEVIWKRDIKVDTLLMVYDVKEVRDGYVFIGRNRSHSDTNLVWLGKWSHSGIKQWERIVPTRPGTIPYRIAPALSGDILIVGKRKGNIELIRVDSKGSL